MSLSASSALRKGLRLALSAARAVRPVARLELGQYELIESALSQAQAKRPGTFLPYGLLDKRAVRECFSGQEDYRVIDVHDPSDADREMLESEGFSLPHIIDNCAVLPSEHASPQAVKRDIDERETRFQREALEARSMRATGPKSGRPLQSSRSLLAEGGTIFYRFVDEDEVFYIAVGREGMGYIRLYLYLPRLRTVLVLGDRDWAWLVLLCH